MRFSKLRNPAGPSRRQRRPGTLSGAGRIHEHRRVAFGGNHVRNVDLTKRILQHAGKTEALIQHVPDRQGHDRRYSLDTTKLRSLGWAPQVNFEDGLAATVRWYLENEWWWRPIKDADPAYRSYYESQYGSRKP